LTVAGALALVVRRRELARAGLRVPPAAERDEPDLAADLRREAVAPLPEVRRVRLVAREPRRERLEAAFGAASAGASARLSRLSPPRPLMLPAELASQAMRRPASIPMRIGSVMSEVAFMPLLFVWFVDLTSASGPAVAGSR